MWAWPLKARFTLGWARTGFGIEAFFSIVNQGIASTGHFNGFLDLIFRSDRAGFSYSGQISDGGRNLVEYGYRVPLEASHYDVVFHGQTVKTAYEGTLVIDPHTAELVRMTLRSSHLPSESGACEITHTMNYGRFRLNGSDFLLPSEAHLHMKELNGGIRKTRRDIRDVVSFLANLR